MGQYYTPIIMGKRYGVHGTLYSWDYKEGLKLMEHSYLGTDLTNAVLSKIDHRPMRIAWMGDYADDYPEDDSKRREPYQQKLLKNEFMRIFKQQDKKRIFPAPLEGFKNPEDFNGWYLINHTQQTYVDLGEYQQMNSWEEEWDGKKYQMAVHPLPLLTACGNGRGGGDYHDCYPDYDMVGRWAFDLIEFASYKPVGFTEEIYRFKEERV